MIELDPLRPVTALFPDRSKRWVADACRAGRVPGAVKIGRAWLIAESAAAKLTGGEVARAKKTEDEEIDACLRAMGVAA